MITGFNHVGIAVEDMDSAIRLMEMFMQAEVVVRKAIPEAGQESAIIRIGDSQIELMSALDEEGVVGKYLRKHGPGLHHISLRTDDFDKDVADLEMKGVMVFGKTRIFGKKVCFAHPKTTGGILYEILEAYKPEELREEMLKEPDEKSPEQRSIMEDGVEEIIRKKDNGEYALIGRKCSACGFITFPESQTCIRCGSEETEKVELDEKGTLYTFTQTMRPVNHMPAGNITGYIDLDDGTRLFSPIDMENGEVPRIGSRMKIKIRPLWTEEEHVEILGYAAVPAEEET